jgi:antitoxin ParD1/3/4
MADIDFAANAEDERIIRLAIREDERPSDVIRRALRLLHRQMWQDRLRAAPRPAVEDLS